MPKYNCTLVRKLIIPVGDDESTIHYQIVDAVLETSVELEQLTPDLSIASGWSIANTPRPIEEK